MKFRDSALGVALRETVSLLWLVPFGVGAGVIGGALSAGILWPVFVVGGLLVVAVLTVLVVRWRRQVRERQRLARAKRVAEGNEAYWRANVDESK